MPVSTDVLILVILLSSASYLSLSPIVTDNTAATAQVNIDINHKMNTNPSYDCVSLQTSSKSARTSRVKTDINPSYDCVTFGTARQPISSTDTIENNINYCYSTHCIAGQRRN